MRDLGVSALSAQSAGGAAAMFWCTFAALFPQAESSYDLLITLDVLPAHIFEQGGPCSDHLQQATSGCVVFAMSLEMLGEVVNPLGQQGNLHFRGAGITLMRFKIGNDTFFFLLRQHLLDKSFLECPSHIFHITFYESHIILSCGNHCKPFPAQL